MGKIILNGKEYVTSTTRGFPPLIYSDDEREVGVWRDGKPLYQKSFTGTSSDTTFQISISSLNVDRFVDGQISVVASGGSVKSIVYFANSTDFTRMWISGSNLNVEIGSNYPARPINYAATILYTKTTDTAGSGKYSAVGDLMHHYSETEQVVGTWVNGKTLYEKFIASNTQISLTKGAWTTIGNIADLNANAIIKLEVFTYKYSRPFYAYIVDDIASNGDIKINSQENWYAQSFLIQYTKSSN